MPRVASNRRKLSPTNLLETAQAHQRSAAPGAAIELDLFTAIAEGYRKVPDLARRCGAAERGVRILADYLVLTGLVTKRDHSYALTPDSAVFLDRRSAGYLGSAAGFLSSALMADVYKTVPAAVRKGGTVLGEHGSLLPQNPIWVEHARAMAPMLAMPAELLATMLEAEAKAPWKVLDIGAGHGLFGITLAKRNPKAEIVALDWDNVLQVARENAREAGVESRYHTISGDAFQSELGSGYDLVLITNFLHHFSKSQCETLLGRVYSALADEGRAVVFDFVPDDSRVSPAPSAAFALTMLVTTPEGDAYTFAEYEQIFRGAGFNGVEQRPLPPAREQVIIAYR